MYGLPETISTGVCIIVLNIHSSTRSTSLRANSRSVGSQMPTICDGNHLATMSTNFYCNLFILVFYPFGYQT